MEDSGPPQLFESVIAVLSLPQPFGSVAAILSVPQPFHNAKWKTQNSSGRFKMAKTDSNGCRGLKSSTAVYKFDPFRMGLQ